MKQTILQLKERLLVMSRLNEIIQKVTANGMREITEERAKEIAIEYAKECSQASLEKASGNSDIKCGNKTMYCKQCLGGGCEN